MINDTTYFVVCKEFSLYDTKDVRKVFLKGLIYDDSILDVYPWSDHMNRAGKMILLRESGHIVLCISIVDLIKALLFKDQ